MDYTIEPTNRPGVPYQDTKAGEFYILLTPSGVECEEGTPHLCVRSSIQAGGVKQFASIDAGAFFRDDPENYYDYRFIPLEVVTGPHLRRK